MLEPGSTVSEFQTVAGELPHAGQPTAEVVAVALESLGHQPSVLSSWFNWARATAASRLLPRPLAAHVAKGMMAEQTPQDMR